MNQIEQFLKESNAIEGVYDYNSFEQAKMAWEFAIGLEQMQFDELLHIHALLMINLNSRIAGKLRKVDVMVGGRICPKAGSVRRMLYQFIPNLNRQLGDMIEGIKEDVCRAIHVDFERIHPFEDGNGRVGRILYNWQRVKNGLPIHIIKESEKQEYYKWFK